MAKHTTTAEIHESDKHATGATATYCMDDDKIRLYVGRVERETYNYLRQNKFVATPKQSCDFVATWSPNAEDIAYSLIEEGDEIGDEDYSPEERAADRAERFAGYRDKRAGEAHGHADTYEDGPAAFGNQNAARAERQAARHERHRGRALTQWSKAEYWQERTAGVISNALHRSDAATRRGRILTIEADIRKIEASYTPKKNASTYTDEKDGETYVYCSPGGRGGEWVKVSSLEYRKAAYARAITHLQRRLIYENAMLENEGGQASEVEMIPGGFITYKNRWGNTARGEYQIQKINRSPATKRVTSVEIVAPRSVHRKGQLIEEVGRVLVNIERKGEDIYRAPTPEELEEFNAAASTAKAARKAAAPAKPKLINPTLEAAQALQDEFNRVAKEDSDKRSRYYGDFEPLDVCDITQATYSKASKGEYARAETRTLHAGGKLSRRESNMWTREGSEYDKALGPALCSIRIVSRFPSYQVVVLTDKPQHALPDWTQAPAETPAPEPVAEEIETTEETPEEAPEPIEAAAQELVTAPAGCLF